MSWETIHLDLNQDVNERINMKFIILLLFTSTLYAQEGKDLKTIYKYKEYEIIDLGQLEVKGQIMAPGDLTINDRERPHFKRELLERPDFDQESRKDIEHLR